MTTMLDELEEVLELEVDAEMKLSRVRKVTDAPFRSICSLHYHAHGRTTGLLIGPRTVLTSGSTVQFVTGSARNPAHLTVFPGYPTKLPDTVGKTTAIKFIPCPNSMRNTRTDLAIVHLDKALGTTFGYWKEPMGVRELLNVQLPFPIDDIATLTMAGYPRGSRQNSQYQATGISLIPPTDGLLTLHGFKDKGFEGSPVWGTHATTGVRILAGVNIGAPPRQTVNRAVALEPDILKFISANTK